MPRKANKGNILGKTKLLSQTYKAVKQNKRFEA
jgi:hypothetical protein